MAKARKLPSGNWHVEVYTHTDESGTRKYQPFTAPTEAEANYLAVEFVYKKKRMSNPENMTVGEAIDRYIESKDAVLSPSTITGYKRARKNYLKALMTVKIGTLTQEVIQRHINAMSKTHSPKTVANAYGLLTATLKIYYPDLIVKVSLPQKRHTELKTPETEDITRILAVVKGSAIELPVLLALWLSLRMSEVRGLKWCNVSSDSILIDTTVVDVLDGATAEKGTKSNAGTRKLPLPPYIKALLDSTPHASEYVVPMSGAAIYKRFMRMLEAAGLPHYSFHALRHANASVMLALNVPDKYAMKRGGWATNSTLKNVYQQTFSTEEIAISEKINNYFESAIQYDIPHDTQK